MFFFFAILDCSRSKSDCAQFDMLFDMTHPKGDGEDFCKTGARVRCVVKPTAPLQPPSPSNTLTVISYNLFDGMFKLSHDGQRERTCRIPAIVNKEFGDADVVVFQEHYNGKVFYIGLCDSGSLLISTMLSIQR